MLETRFQTGLPKLGKGKLGFRRAFGRIQGFTQSETLNMLETKFQAGLPKLGRGKL